MSAPTEDLQSKAARAVARITEIEQRWRDEEQEEAVVTIEDAVSELEQLAIDSVDSETADRFTVRKEAGALVQRVGAALAKLAGTVGGRS